jgi:hypothetical protein
LGASPVCVGTNFENAPTPGERLNDPLPNVEVVAGAVDCVTGAGDPNILVIPNPAFGCVSFVPSPSDMPKNDNSWPESVDIDSVDSDGWI